MNLSELTNHFAFGPKYRSAATKKTYSKIMKAYVQPMIAELGEPKDLKDRVEMSEYAMRATEWLEKYSSKTGSMVMSMLRSSLRSASDFGQVTFHAPFKIPEAENEVITIAAELYREVFQKAMAGDQEIDTFILLACLTGARSEDILRLTQDNMINEDNTLLIYYRPNKTKQHTKPIEVFIQNKMIVDRLTPFAGFRRQYQDQYNDLRKWVNELDSPSANKKYLKNILLTGGDSVSKQYIGKDTIRFHRIRATFITSMLELGIPERVIKYFSGHSSNSAGSSFSRYIQVTKEFKDKEYDRYLQWLTY